MKTRLIAAAILVPVLLLIVLVADKIVAAIIFGLMMAVGAYELLYRTGLVRHMRLVLYSAIMAFSVTMWSYAGAIHAYGLIMIIAFCFFLFGEMMYDHIKVRFEMISMCFFAGFLVPYLMSAIIRILTMSLGRYLILIPFVIGFLSDAGAYFVGMKFGRHKLAPVVSPNKTIEGFLGGMGAAVVGAILYTVILNILHFQVNYLVAILYGLLGSAVGSFGDLCFSIIKRQTGIKDYGNLIPGHGGILDRFDSMMLVAPLIEMLLHLIPLAV